MMFWPSFHFFYFTEVYLEYMSLVIVFYLKITVNTGGGFSV